MMPDIPHHLEDTESRPVVQAERQVELPPPFETSSRAVSTDSDDPVATRRTTDSDARTTRTTASSTLRTTARVTRSSSTASPTRTTLASSTRSTRSTASSSSASTRTSSLTSTVTSAQSLIFPNSFPPDFPVQTLKPMHRPSGGRGYAFLKDNELADSMLIFAAFLIVSLISTIVLVKSTHMRSRRQGSKVDQMVGEDMKWQERREVLERRIIWEKGGWEGKGRKLKSAAAMGRGEAAAVGWKELSEMDKRR